MVIREAGSLDELITDCAELPRTLRARETTAPHAPAASNGASPVSSPAGARPWWVDEACLAQVHNLGEYG